MGGGCKRRRKEEMLEEKISNIRKERNRERGRKENGRENPPNKRRINMVGQGRGGGDDKQKISESKSK